MDNKSVHMDNMPSSSVLMIGDYAGNDATGGMAAVIQNYRRYIPDLKYIYTWRPSSSRIYKLLILIFAYIQVIFRLLFDRNIALVHIHTCSGMSFWRSAGFLRLSKAFGKKVILHMHGGRFKDFYEESDSKEKMLGLIASADIFVVLSNPWRDWFISIGVCEKNIRVLNNMVIPPACVPERNNDGVLALLFLGNVVKAKGIYDLLEVLADNAQRWKGKVVLKIGGEVAGDMLERTIRENALDDIVEYCGYATGHQKDELMSWCDVLVLPSYYEGLPMSILEAMSWFRPVIASRVGGIPSVVHDGENGILTEPGNKESIASAVESFLSHPELVDRYGSCSAEIVRDYLPDSVMGVLAEIYTSLMQREQER